VGRVSCAEHAHTLTICGNIAGWRCSGRSGLGSILRAAALRERVLGAEHLQMLTARANLAH
jgi:hypothetical protein